MHRGTENTRLKDSLHRAESGNIQRTFITTNVKIPKKVCPMVISEINESKKYSFIVFKLLRLLEGICYYRVIYLMLLDLQQINGIICFSRNNYMFLAIKIDLSIKTILNT